MRRAYFHGRSVGIIAWLFLEPIVARIMADAHGQNRTRSTLRKR